MFNFNALMLPNKLKYLRLKITFDFDNICVLLRLWSIQRTYNLINRVFNLQWFS